jgi:hypothetical protein
MPHLCDESNKDGEIGFKWLEIKRCENNLTFFGSYYIRTCMTIQMGNARTLESFLVGLTLLDDMEMDVCVDKVDEHLCEVHNAFSTDQATSRSLKETMELETQELVC